MKKSILLLTAGIFAMIGAQGQYSTSSVILERPSAQNLEAQRLSMEEMQKMHDTYMTRFANQKQKGANKTTATYGDWYSLWNQNFNSTGINVALGYYWGVFPDSNIIYTGTSHTYVHGMGMSFDPTDSAYYSTSVNFGCLSSPVSQAMPPIGQPYIIDSFFTPVKYMRTDPTTTLVDSLIIELVVAINASATTVDTGSYNLKFASKPYFINSALDMTPRFGTIRYNSGVKPPYNVAPYINDCYFDSVLVAPPYKQRFALALNSTTVADTDANGFLNLGALLAANGGTTTSTLQPLNITPVTLKSTQHMVSFISFKSGKAGGTYPLGATAVNWMKLYAGSPRSVSGTPATTASFLQSASNAGIGYPGSYQASLIITNQSRYNDTGFAYPAGRHNVLVPASAYAGNTPPVYDFVVTEDAFHVKWTTNPSLGVNEVDNSLLSNVAVYPNPASNMVNVSYAVADNTPVAVTLTNMFGQVVATQTGTNGKVVFNVAGLASGLYTYSVAAGTERISGRVVVAH